MNDGTFSRILAAHPRRSAFLWVWKLPLLALLLAASYAFTSDPPPARSTQTVDVVLEPAPLAPPAPQTPIKRPGPRKKSIPAEPAAAAERPTPSEPPGAAAQAQQTVTTAEPQ